MTRADIIARAFVDSRRLRPEQAPRIRGLVLTLRAWYDVRQAERIGSRVLHYWTISPSEPVMRTRDDLFVMAGLADMCPFATPPEDADRNLVAAWRETFYAETARALVGHGWLEKPASADSALVFTAAALSSLRRRRPTPPASPQGST